MEAVVHDRATLAAFHRVVKPAHASCNREALAATRARYVVSWLLSSAWAAFQGPVTIVAGHHDSWVGYEDALALVRAFPRCRYAVIPGCGNLMPIEVPVELRRWLVDWLAWCGRESTSAAATI